jgi:hypothetical protein
MKASYLFTRTMLGVGFSASVVACSPGFETSKSSCGSSESCQSGSLGTGGGTGDSHSSWESLSMEGSINGGRFDRSKAVELDKSARQLVLRLPFIAGIQIGAQIPTQIPELPGATIGIEPAADGASSLVLRIPLEKVLKGAAFLPKGRLPNGDALPAIPEGELPTLGLGFNNQRDLRGAIYLSPTVVGLFINTKFDPYIRLTLPIRDQARTRTYGYFTSIPAKPNFDGGFFLSVALPDDLARAIDDLL